MGLILGPGPRSTVRVRLEAATLVGFALAAHALLNAGPGLVRSIGPATELVPLLAYPVVFIGFLLIARAARRGHSRTDTALD